MAIPDEQRKWIEKVARDSFYTDLPDEEFNALTDDDFDRPFREFFATLVDPEELHLFASLFNWDGGVEELRDVIQHPLCDLGTAMLVYWRGQPGYDLQYADREAVPDHRREVWDLLREIEQRVAEGRFMTASQSYDPATDNGYDQRPKPERVKRFGRDLPAIMYRAVV